MRNLINPLYGNKWEDVFYACP